MGGRILINAVSSANAGKSAEVFSRMECTLDRIVWVVNADGSDGVRVDVVVREETLIWRVASCSWSSIYLAAYVELSSLSWTMVE